MKKRVMFANNGNTAVMDKNGQIPELQESWLALFFKFLEAQGQDPQEFEFELPSGLMAIPIKMPPSVGGWNWRIERGK